MTKPRVLHVAGHVNTQNITLDGLCTAVKNQATVTALRGMTGTGGEQNFTANMAALQADLMNQTGLIDARAIDCTYSEDAYINWKPNLVIAHHIHRDGQNRAMFAVPDNAFAFHSPAANAESVRFMARVMGGYTAKTGIPITQDAVTLRMRQLYTWCYIDESSSAIIPEYGNGNLDTVALFNADAVQKIGVFFRDCVLEHFDLVMPSPTPPPPHSDLAPAIAALREVVNRINAVASQLENL